MHWIKVFHIMMVIAWMAGLFYLPRIFVHYVEGLNLGEDVHRLGVMATKLFRFMTLMAIQAILAGLWLWIGYGITGAWLYAKLLFVFALLVYHLICWFYLKRLLSNDLAMSGIYLRCFNEAPLLMLIPILVFVVVKPI
ncbi:MAG: CopD family protein [Gammaproteobacteria bacterium]|jgi:protoporphyrinogen IX oxidase|nr:CopD family protein [Gammaproteobacteria bacterium]MBT4494851.1 CopD family protein [Gammaproteobacteria bacterium]MBT7370819.1 CopD family protein [Gammaproteobacteria bacterium]